jgi:hypothetical protein
MVMRHSPGSRRLTLGADKAYDVHEFVDDLRDLNVTPHIAQNTTNRSSAIDARHRLHNRTCAFQAMSRTFCGKASSRSYSFRLTRACMR